jgi:probable Rubsico expression protein CbbX
VAGRGGSGGGGPSARGDGLPPRGTGPPARRPRLVGPFDPGGPLGLPLPGGQAGRRARRRRSRQPDPQAPLPPEALVSFAALRAESGIDDVLAGLDRELVGLQPVKTKIREIASLLLVSQVRERFGLVAPRPSLHMCFTGSPGTGKTTVGLRMADLLHRLGYLDRGHMVAAMRDDLVGEYIGQTAPRTKKVVSEAMGGVLFIDEAYHLHRAENAQDYGKEVIEILLQMMENERDKIVVIFAGYKDRMDAFFEVNPGMRSRVAHHLDFADYQLDELEAIGEMMVGQSSYYLSDEAAKVLRDVLSVRMNQPRFAHGRTVRNALERAQFVHASRLISDADRSWSRDDLMRLEDIDLIPVLVAAEDAGASPPAD